MPQNIRIWLKISNWTIIIVNPICLKGIRAYKEEAYHNLDDKSLKKQDNEKI